MRDLARLSFGREAEAGGAAWQNRRRRRPPPLEQASSRASEPDPLVESIGAPSSRAQSIDISITAPGPTKRPHPFISNAADRNCHRSAPRVLLAIRKRPRRPRHTSGVRHARMCDDIHACGASLLHAHNTPLAHTTHTPAQGLTDWSRRVALRGFSSQSSSSKHNGVGVGVGYGRGWGWERAGQGALRQAARGHVYLVSGDGLKQLHVCVCVCVCTAPALSTDQSNAGCLWMRVCSSNPSTTPSPPFHPRLQDDGRRGAELGGERALLPPSWPGARATPGHRQGVGHGMRVRVCVRTYRVECEGIGDWG